MGEKEKVLVIAAVVIICGLIACLLILDGQVLTSIAFLEKEVAEQTEKRHLHASLYEFGDSKDWVCDIPPRETLQKMTLPQVAELFHRYMRSQQVLCKQVERMGAANDGGWDICVDDNYKPGNPCLVYSFGIAKDFSFDDSISEEYGCEVHSFDPSGRTGLSGDYKRSDKVTFHKLGLSNFTGGSEKFKVATFREIKKQLGQSERILDVVKMDIEYSEWVSLTDMMKHGDLEKVKQLSIEIHLHKRDPTFENYTKLLRVLRELYYFGFRMTHMHHAHCVFYSEDLDRWEDSCYDVSFLNMRYY